MCVLLFTNLRMLGIEVILLKFLALLNRLVEKDLGRVPFRMQYSTKPTVALCATQQLQKQVGLLRRKLNQK